MIPLIYTNGAASFSSLGLGAVPDALACNVHEERNGPFELTLTAPATSAHAALLGVGNLIVADASPQQKRQAFEIIDTRKTLDGRIYVEAVHISYRLKYSILKSFTEASASAFFTLLNTKTPTNYIEGNGFTFKTDITSAASISQADYQTVRDVLGGIEGSALDVYGGTWKWDNFTASLLASRGSDNGVRILYGKNLQDLTVEADADNVVDGVWAIFTESGVTTVRASEIKYGPTRGEYSYGRTVIRDFAGDFDSTPTQGQLDIAAQAWIDTQGTIPVNLAATWIPLSDAIEYRDLAPVESVELDDTVHVYVEALGVNASAKVIATDYDPLRGRYTAVQIGNFKTSITDAIRAIR